MCTSMYTPPCTLLLVYSRPPSLYFMMSLESHVPSLRVIQAVVMYSEHGVRWDCTWCHVANTLKISLVQSVEL